MSKLDLLHDNVIAQKICCMLIEKKKWKELSHIFWKKCLIITTFVVLGTFSYNPLLFLLITVCLPFSVCWLPLGVNLLWSVYLFQSVKCRWGLLVKECLPFLVCWLPLDVYLLWSVYLIQSVDCRWGFTCYEVLTFSVCWLPLGVYLLWSVYLFSLWTAAGVLLVMKCWLFRSVDCHWGFTCYGVFTFSVCWLPIGGLLVMKCWLSVCWLPLGVYLLWSVYLFQSVDCRWWFTCYGLFNFFSLLTAAGCLLVMECLPFSVCWLPLGVYFLRSAYLFQSVDCRWLPRYPCCAQCQCHLCLDRVVISRYPGPQHRHRVCSGMVQVRKTLNLRRMYKNL